MNQIKDFVGLTVSAVHCDGQSEIFIKFSNGEIACIQHIQDCCESVGIERIDGDFKSLVGKKLVDCSEERGDDPEWYVWRGYRESYTWTIQKFVAEDGCAATVYWLGESNGHYGETPEVCDTKLDQFHLFDEDETDNLKPQIGGKK